MIVTYLKQPYVDASTSADLGYLLLGFLDFFGNQFDYNTTGISIHAGFFMRLPGEPAAIFVDDPVRPGADPRMMPSLSFEPPSNLSASSFNFSSVATAWHHSHARLLACMQFEEGFPQGCNATGETEGEFPSLPSPAVSAPSSVLPRMIQSYDDLVRK